MNVEPMTRDIRPIKGIYYGGGEEGYTVGGVAGITHIDAYEEHGPAGPMIWFKMWKNAHLAVRANAIHIGSVVYADPPGDGGN